MYKIIKANKDTYITNRVVQNERMTSANVGGAGTLDLFKLYGQTLSSSNPNTELSRLLIKFDLDVIRDLVSTNKLDINHSSFKCHLKLFDVYGGQPTPKNFRVTTHPLSKSFDEGLGRDVVLYQDVDVCNFLTASEDSGPWLLSGANSGGLASTQVDYLTSVITNGTTASLEFTQLFETGLEDLSIDVTTAISATISNLIPDEGFRISLTSSLENNNKTYFVKRFASRTAYNEDKHPQLIVKFNDSIVDDSSNITFNAPNNLFLYNYVQGQSTNLTSGAFSITGSNSLMLRLMTEVSGGSLSFSFTGSQYVLGTNIPMTGVYTAQATIPLNETLRRNLNQTGSVRFTPIWGSLDGTVGYHTGTYIYAYPPTRGSSTIEPKKYRISISGLKPEIDDNEELTLRVDIFDDSQAQIIKSRKPRIIPGVVIHDVYYSIRDESTNVVRVPFDKTNNSTRVSSDGDGMYFKLDASNLVFGRSYVVDILVSTNNNDQIYRNVSSPFRVVNFE